MKFIQYFVTAKFQNNWKYGSGLKVRVKDKLTSQWSQANRTCNDQYQQIFPTHKNLFCIFQYNLLKTYVQCITSNRKSNKNCTRMRTMNTTQVTGMGKRGWTTIMSTVRKSSVRGRNRGWADERTSEGRRWLWRRRWCSTREKTNISIRRAGAVGQGGRGKAAPGGRGRLQTPSGPAFSGKHTPTDTGRRWRVFLESKISQASFAGSALPPMTGRRLGRRSDGRAGAASEEKQTVFRLGS